MFLISVDIYFSYFLFIFAPTIRKYCGQNYIIMLTRKRSYVDNKLVASTFLCITAIRLSQLKIWYLRDALNIAAFSKNKGNKHALNK